MKSIINFFTSIKLAIVLLIIIIIASILGTLIPQQRSQEEYVTRYGQLATLFQRLQLTRLYHSLWFIFLLLLFSLNIIMCTLARFSPKLKKTFRPKIDTEPKSLMALRIKDRLRINAPLASAMDEIRKELARRRYRLNEAAAVNKISLLARKKVLGWFGSDIVHLGLLVILAGGIVSGIAGFRTDLTLRESQVLAIPKADFSVRLDKFETEYYPNGSVKDWKSHLTVMENDSARLSKVVEVNHPLSYKGFVFYQSAYGWDWQNATLEVWGKKKDDPSFLQKLHLRVGEKTQVGDGGFRITLLHFVPDFVLNERNQVASRSMEPNNPAAYIEGWEEEKKIFSGWIFAKFPDFSRIHSVKESNWEFELKDLNAASYSVVQMSKDPGTNFIWVGCTFLMIGLFLAFYWPTREIRMVLEESHEKTNVTAGGISAKGREAFQSEFESFMTSIRKRK